MKRTSNKVLATLLVLLFIGAMPLSALAEGDGGQTGQFISNQISIEDIAQLKLILLDEETDATTPPTGEQPERSIVMSLNVGVDDVLVYGESVIVLTATLNGYEDVDYTLFWECDKGNGWEVMEGETSLTYTFIYTEENAAWLYRIGVAYQETVEPTEQPASPAEQQENLPLLVLVP